MDALTWVIVAAFYAPLHYLVPLLITAFRSSDRERTARLRRTAIDCTLSMFVGFVLVIWLAQDRLQLAMSILFVSMLVPYARLLRAGEAKAGS
ncbi:MAG: hypothetical protein D6720_12400 [Gammaproteobacteria bacterium]|nr:MAG: hypothetical protein D6720_12400 [Gammaproteobacteria bacterium]